MRLFEMETDNERYFKYVVIALERFLFTASGMEYQTYSDIGFSRWNPNNEKFEFYIMLDENQYQIEIEYLTKNIYGDVDAAILVEAEHQDNYGTLEFERTDDPILYAKQLSQYLITFFYENDLYIEEVEI